MPDATDPVTMYGTPRRFNSAMKSEIKSGGSMEETVPDSVLNVLFGEIGMLPA